MKFLNKESLLKITPAFPNGVAVYMDPHNHQQLRLSALSRIIYTIQRLGAINPVVPPPPSPLHPPFLFMSMFLSLSEQSNVLETIVGNLNMTVP